MNYDNPPDQSAVHYEIKETTTKDLERIEAVSAVKTKVFHAMDQLDGWCSKFKASVLVDLVLMLKPENVVEVGVFGGKSLVPMAIACQSINKGVVTGIDPWSADRSIEGMDGANFNWWGSINHEAILNHLISKINHFELNEWIVLSRNTSEGAEPIQNIDILHIDGNHSEKAAEFDIKKWVPLVRKGGVVIMDDINWDGPKKAMEWLNMHCTKLAEFDDSGSSWGIWVKS